MSTPLSDYKAFIDGLVKVRDGVLANRVRENHFPATPEHTAIAEICARLSDEDRGALAQYVAHAREGGIHDALVYLNDRMAIDDYRLTKAGSELPHQPFDTELYYDWMSRLMGDTWPDERDDEKA